MQTEQDATLAYYAKNAQDYVARTQSVDMSNTRKLLTQRLAPGASILDAGCGGGRDALAFQQEGFEVTAFDGCQELAQLASVLLGKTALTLRLEEVQFKNQFDAVWACGSLLHLRHDALVDAMGRLLASLKPTGCLVALFKLGETERTAEDGRHFTDLTPARAQALVQEAGGRLLSTHVDADKLGRGNDWLTLMAEPGEA